MWSLSFSITQSFGNETKQMAGQRTAKELATFRL